MNQNTKKPSLFVGPVVVTNQPTAKSAKEPQGIIARMYAQKGEYLMRVVRDPVEMARNAAAFVKAAATRGLVRIGRTGLESAEVAKTGLEAGDRGEADYEQPGNFAGLPGPSGERAGLHPSWPPASAAGSPFGPPPRGAENGIYGPGQPGSVKPLSKAAEDNKPFTVEPNGDGSNSFINKFTKSLATKQCAAPNCTERFSSGDEKRLLCSAHAYLAGRV